MGVTYKVGAHLKGEECTYIIDVESIMYFFVDNMRENKQPNIFALIFGQTLTDTNALKFHFKQVLS